MKRKYCNKSKRISCLTYLLMLFLFLSACGARIRVYEKDVEPMVKEETERKYGIDVDVLGIEFYPGNQALEEGNYYVDVAYDDKEFRVTIGNGSGEIKDDYAKYLIGESIEEKIQATFKENASATITDYEYKIIYYPSEYKWTDRENSKDYFAQTDSYVNIKLYLNGGDSNAVAEDIYKLFLELENENIFFFADAEYKGAKLNICSHTNYLSVCTLEEIKQELSEVE